ncbi:hypothetical protein Pelo_7474 [Pelomyxa schiedti]|nr:hypothetical protein Pelo_7474 [Pelomyxa schiedti]
MYQWNRAIAVAAFRHPNRKNPCSIPRSTPLSFIAAVSDWTLREPVHLRFQRTHEKTISKTPPHETKDMHEHFSSSHWYTMVQNLNVPGLNPSVRNSAMCTALNIRCLNNKRAHFSKVSPMCRHGCDSPESVKHILYSCSHLKNLRAEIKLNPLKALNVLPASPNTIKKSAVQLNQLYLHHTSNLPPHLAEREFRVALGLECPNRPDEPATIPPKFTYNPTLHATSKHTFSQSPTHFCHQ